MVPVEGGPLSLDDSSPPASSVDVKYGSDTVDVVACSSTCVVQLIDGRLTELISSSLPVVPFPPASELPDPLPSMTESLQVAPIHPASQEQDPSLWEQLPCSEQLHLSHEYHQTSLHYQ